MPAQGQLFAVTGRDDGTDLPAEIIGLIETPAASRTADQKTQLWAYYAGHSGALASVRTDLANAEQRLQALTQHAEMLKQNLESAIEFEHSVDESEDVVEKFKEFLDHVSAEDFEMPETGDAGDSPAP